MSEWRDVAALRAWLEHDGDIDGEALPIRSVLSRLDRAPGESHGKSPGMVVDGDMLRDVIAEAVPRLISDDAAREIAEAALDGAVRAGMTVLQGPALLPRVPREAS